MTFAACSDSTKSFLKLILFLLHLLDLSCDVLENTVSTEIIKLSKCRVDSFCIAKSDGSRAVCFVDSLRLVIEYDLVELLCIYYDRRWPAVVFVEDAVVQQALLSVDSSAIVSTLA